MKRTKAALSNARTESGGRKAWLAAGLVPAVLLATSFAAGPARAAGVNIAPEPDIFASFINITYDPMVGTSFDASGVAFNIDANGFVDIPIMGGLFDIDADVDTMGGLLAGGTLTVTGTVNDPMSGLMFGSGTLLTGDLTSLSSGDPMDGFEFLFSVTGGDAAGLYGSVGATGAVTLSSTGFTSFASAIMPADDADVRSVVASVSEPAAFGISALGFIGLMALRRRREVNSGTCLRPA